MEPRVSAFLLVWNNWQSAVRSLESLFDMRYPNFNVVVMDQASEDGTVDRIKEWAAGRLPVEGKYIDYKSGSKPIQYAEYSEDELLGVSAGADSSFSGKLVIIKNKTNYGYNRARSSGVSFILRVFKSDWILSVDNDNILPPDFLQRMIAITQKEPEAGILGPKILDYQTEKIWHEGGTFNRWTGDASQGTQSLRSRAEGKEYIQADWVVTACALYSRKLFEKIGLWADNALYDIAIDTGLTAIKHGFKVLYVPSVTIWNERAIPKEHEKYREIAKDRWAYSLPLAELLIIKRHTNKLQYISAMIFFGFRQVKAAVRFLLFSRKWHRVKLHLRGIMDYRKESGNKPGSV